MVTSLLAFFVSQQPTCCPPTMAEFATDPAFVVLHLAPLPFHFVAQTGKNATFGVDGEKEGTGFFVPAEKGNHVGIVLIHEWWGLNDYIRKTAESLHAKTGYAVLAVDLYEGKVATTGADAGKFMQEVDSTRAKAVVKAAVKALRSGSLGSRSTKIGSVGYCFGGGWAYNTAVEGSRGVQACVMYYGMPDTSPLALSELKAPVMFVHPKRDQFINDGVVKRFEAAMKSIKNPFETYHYDADHAFANPSNPRFNKEAAADAEKHELAFFKKYLG